MVARVSYASEIMIKSAPRDRVTPAAAAWPRDMSGLSDMQAKRLVEALAKRLTTGRTDSFEFQQGLRQYHTYQAEQRDAGIKTREGKHSVKLAPLIDALPAKQRA